MESDSLVKKEANYRTLTECRLCHSTDLKPFIDFGNVPLAGAFLKTEQIPSEQYYPMSMQFCRSCTNVQVDTVIPVDVLFKNYFYFSSAIQTLREHFSLLAEELSSRFVKPKQSLVVEIGCNDGVFLRHLAAKDIRNVGVDPASNVVATIKDPGVVAINDEFGEAVAKKIVSEHGLADAIVSSFSFAHIDDMDNVMRGINTLLSSDGVFIFEIYYLGVVIEEMQYDMMYHEHMSYYTFACMEKFLGSYGLEVFDVKKIPLRSGTLRFYCQRKSQHPHPISPNVNLQREEEVGKGLLDEKTYENYGAKIQKTKNDLLKILNELKNQNMKVIGYGASGRATTIMNFCKIDTRYLDYVVDDAPAKQGYLTPGTHVPIISWDQVKSMPKIPDYVLVFAWPFIDEVKKRRKDYLDEGGKFIVPLPDVRILGA